jgi:hypothetical protein
MAARVRKRWRPAPQMGGGCRGSGGGGGFGSGGRLRPATGVERAAKWVWGKRAGERPRYLSGHCAQRARDAQRRAVPDQPSPNRAGPGGWRWPEESESPRRRVRRCAGRASASGLSVARAAPKPGGHLRGAGPAGCNRRPVLRQLFHSCLTSDHTMGTVLFNRVLGRQYLDSRRACSCCCVDY